MVSFFALWPGDGLLENFAANIVCIYCSKAMSEVAAFALSTSNDEKNHLRRKIVLTILSGARSFHLTYEQVVDSINDPQPMWTEYNLNGALDKK